MGRRSTLRHGLEHDVCLPLLVFKEQGYVRWARPVSAAALARSKGILSAVIVTLALNAAVGCVTRSGPETFARNVRFGKHDRARLAWLISEGRKTATIVIAYPPGQGGPLMRGLAVLSGRVRYQADTLGYLRVDVPIQHVLQASALPGIDAISINGVQFYGASP